MKPAGPASVLHHVTLPHRGGAVRVARLLIMEQRRAGLDARLSFELDETDPEELGGHPDLEGARIPLLGPTPPEELGRALAGLVEKGFVRRATAHEDKRESRLRLTAAGRRVHDDIVPLALAHERALLERLTSEERHWLMRILDAVHPLPAAVTATSPE